MTDNSTAAWGLYWLVMGDVRSPYSTKVPVNLGDATINLQHQAVKDAYADTNKLDDINVYCFLCYRMLLCTVQDVHFDVAFPDHVGRIWSGKEVYWCQTHARKRENCAEHQCA
jgi:hypothetical protein